MAANTSDGGRNASGNTGDTRDTGNTGKGRNQQPMTTAIILAAGLGTRMQSDLPKGLQPLGGKSLLSHLLDTLQSLSRPLKVLIVASNQNLEQLRDAVGAVPDYVDWVVQPEPLGTGDAVRQAMQAKEVAPGPVLVLFADVPLIRAATIDRLLDDYWQPGGIALLSMELDNPRGYGRIMRDNTGVVLGVVEEDDASELQANIREVNTGVLVADSEPLKDWLGALKPHSTGEFYLPDLVGLASLEGVQAQALKLEDAREAFGANNRMQLQSLERYWQLVQAEALMEQGVWIADASRLEIRGTVTAGRNVFVDVGVVLEGQVDLADGVRIGPYCVIRDCILGEGTQVEAWSWMRGVKTGRQTTIGPFARLRPGTDLGDGSKVGNFVEVKNAVLGTGVSASHLSYLGDAEVGDNTNIGAGTITCNYDGENKNRTTIGRDAFIGSNSSLVAPVEVGDGARVGAGSVITKPVGEGELAVAREKQKNVRQRDGYKSKSRSLFDDDTDQDGADDGKNKGKSKGKGDAGG